METNEPRVELRKSQERIFSRFMHINGNIGSEDEPPLEFGLPKIK